MNIKVVFVEEEPIYHPNSTINNLIQGNNRVWFSEPGGDPGYLYINETKVPGKFVRIGTAIYEKENIDRGFLREENYENFLRTGNLWED